MQKKNKHTVNTVYCQRAIRTVLSRNLPVVNSARGETPIKKRTKHTDFDVSPAWRSQFGNRAITLHIQTDLC